MKRPFFLAGLALLASCGGGGGGGSGGFHVLQSTPFDGATAVPLDVLVTVMFSEAVDPATVQADTLRVVDDVGAAAPGTTTVLSSSGIELRWTGTEDLEPATPHTVRVSSTLRSRSGMPVTGDLVISFTTGGVPGPPVPLGTIRAAPGDLNQGRSSHRAVLLEDGRVLVTGGFTLGTAVTAVAEAFDPVVEVFTTLASPMQVKRAGHVAVRLADGRVLLAGGQTEGQSLGTLVATATAEVFHPSTDSFAPVGSMVRARSDAAALLLPDGRVLVTGGTDLSVDHADAEVFDPVTNQFTLLASPMAHTRAFHGMEMLGDAHVLVVGGSTDLRPEVFALATDAFSPLAVPAQDAPRFGAAVARFDSGKVSVAGGDALGTVLYGDLNPLQVRNTGSGLNGARLYATSTRIAPDQLLVAGGGDFQTGLILSTIDLIREAGIAGSGTYATPLRFPTGLMLHTATALGDGRVLFCGGLRDAEGQPEKDVAFLYDPPPP